MMRSILLVFVAGWVAWFWVDKPRAGPFGLPPPSDSLVENFQRAFDMLKTGHAKLAYLYIWDAHYLVLSLLGGVLLAMTFGAVSRHFSARRLRSIVFPKRRTAEPEATSARSPDAGPPDHEQGNPR
ncbi:MAG: hypothetical protein P8106_02285 [Gammaproteobacteria bacterium]